MALTPLKVGDKFFLSSGQQDIMVNRWDQYIAVRRGVVEAVWDIPARGCHHEAGVDYAIDGLDSRMRLNETAQWLFLRPPKRGFTRSVRCGDRRMGAIGSTSVFRLVGEPPKRARLMVPV